MAERAFFREDATFEEGNPNCVTTSIESVEKPDWVNLVANLVTNNIQLESTQQNVAAHLINVNGQRVKSTNFAYGTTITVHDLPKGYYFLAVQAAGLQAIFKVVILR